MKINQIYSPNFDKTKRSRKLIKFIVIHYTGMQSERESINRLCDPKSKVSSHYVISRNGNIYRLVKDIYIAWHAGKSCWGKYKNLNKYSIGIELVNKGHQNGYTNFTKEQIKSLIKICKILIRKYKIKKTNIVGHSDIAPLRKIDPGEKFPWDKLAKNKIGFRFSIKPILLKKFRKIKISKKEEINFLKNINTIGYCFSKRKKTFIKKTVKAFQRRYRSKLITGNIDKECAVIAKNLIKKL